MLGGGLGAGAPRGHPGRVGARVWGWVAPGIPSLWELCPCRHSPRHPSSRPGGTCGSGQGAAGQASQRCAEAPPLPHLLRGPPRPLCLTLALFSLHGHLSLRGECSRRFCRLPAGTSPPAGRRACGVHVPQAAARVLAFVWSVEGVRSRLLLLTFPQKLLNV